MISQNGQRGKQRLYKLAAGMLDKMDDSGLVSLTPSDTTLVTFYVLSSSLDSLAEKQDAMLAELRKFNKPFKLLNGVGEVLGGVFRRVLH